MNQYCPTCGAGMVFYHQNQSWYCHNCQRYAGVAYQAQPADYQAQPANYLAQPANYVQQPANLPDERVSRSKIYGAMQMRETTDKILPTSWAFVILAFQILTPIITIATLYFFLMNGNFNFSTSASILAIVVIFLAVIAMVIVQSVLVYKLVGRRDEHFRRDGLMKQGMIEYLDAMSIKEKKDINVERWTMNSMHYSTMESDRSPALWAMLVGLIAIIPIIGVFALLYVLYFLTKDVHDHDKRQRDFNFQFQLGMLKLGKIDSISYDWIPLPKRDPGVYVLLSILTLGFFLPYWWYVNIVDMNHHMESQWHFEGQITEIIKEEGHYDESSD